MADPVKNALTDLAMLECTVVHRRYTPKSHVIKMAMFMFWVDLDALPKLNQLGPLIGYNQWRLYQFNDRDHYPDGQSAALKDKLINTLTHHGCAISADITIHALVSFRVLGYVFNPVTFYFCANKSGDPIAVIAEVENTFHERKLYVLDTFKTTACGQIVFRQRLPKYFYVSPFLAVDDMFDFYVPWLPNYLSPTAKKTNSVSATVTTKRDDKPVMMGQVALCPNPVPVTTWRLLGMTIRYPFITIWVIAGIHWHALRLWLKGVPFFAKQQKLHLQRGILNPLPNQGGPA